MLQDRAVAYINADSAIEGKATLHSGDSEVAHLYNCSCLLPGMYTLRVDCTPSLHTVVYDLTKQVSVSRDRWTVNVPFLLEISRWLLWSRLCSVHRNVCFVHQLQQDISQPP